MRRILLLAGLAALLTAAPASAEPTLVRDVKTGVWRGGTNNPTAPEPDYVQPDTQIEPSIAVNPANPDNVVATYQEGRIDSGGDATNGFATTFDGGKTWTYGEVPGLTTYPGQGGQFDRASDAVVAFGPDNTVYINSLVFDSQSGNGLRSGITVNVSKDGGRTWSAPVIFQDDQIGGLNDKNWIAVDTSDAPGHHKGRVYVIWDRVAPVVYNYCDHDCDQLSNWLPDLQKIDPVVYPGQGIGAYPYVMDDGSLGMVLDITGGGLPTGLSNTDNPDFEPSGTNHVFMEAVKAGSVPWPSPLSWAPPVNIAGNQSAGQPAQRGTDGLPAAAADAKSGQMYAVWDDQRFRSDKTNDVVMSTSTDGGVTWSPVVRVNPGPKDDHVDHYGATVAVGEDGTVHIGYRVRNESGSSPTFSPAIDSYYQVSHDGGKTFSSPLKIDTQPSHALYGAFSREGTFEGDYDEIATAGGAAYFVRCQGAPASPGEPPALAPEGTGLSLPDSGRGHQHQSCWVSLVRDLPPSSTATVPGVTPSTGFKRVKPLKLRLTRRRFPGHRLRLAVVGGGKSVKVVRFYVGKRRVGIDRRSPFRALIHVRKHHRVLELRAVVQLRDGRRVKLARRLKRRAA